MSRIVFEKALRRCARGILLVGMIVAGLSATAASLLFLISAAALGVMANEADRRLRAA